MQFRQLRYFVKVVEAGSFSRAAETIHVAQPALSQQVAQLEEELGLALLQRTARGVLPTAAGEVFYREASAILHQMEQLPSTIRGGGGEIEGVVNLGVSSTVVAALPGAFLDACSKTYPKVSLKLSIVDSAALKSRVERHALDLAVVFEDELGSTFARKPLFRQRLFLIVREPIPGIGETVHIEQLRARRFVLPTASNITRTALDRVLGPAGISPKVVAEADVLANMLAAVRGGIGDTVLPKGDLSDIADDDLPDPILIEPAIYLTCSIITSPDFPLSHAGDAVRSLLAKFLVDFLRRAKAPGVEFI